MVYGCACSFGRLRAKKKLRTIPEETEKATMAFHWELGTPPPLRRRIRHSKLQGEIRKRIILKAELAVSYPVWPVAQFIPSKNEEANGPAELGSINQTF